MPSPKSRRSKTLLQSSKTAKPRDILEFATAERPESTLSRLEPALDLVDHVNPALAADQTVVAVAATQRFQRVTDLHGTILMR